MFFALSYSYGTHFQSPWNPGRTITDVIDPMAITRMVEGTAPKKSIPQPP
jgi:hypothetical protein